MNESLAKVKLVDWAALGTLLGFVFGLIEAIAWLLGRKLGVIQILWAAPLLSATIAVVVLLLGALIARIFKSPSIQVAAVYLACLLVYEPLRVVSSAAVSAWPVAFASLLLAAIGSILVIRAATSWRTLYRAAAVLAAIVIVTSIYATSTLDNRSSVQASVGPSHVQKNILVIIIDTLRADHLSMSGYSRRTTPHLDRFAATGTAFDNAISASSWTLPAHTSLLTGLYPHDHHAVAVDDRLPANVPIISNWFLQHGYRTATFSANTFYFSRANGFGRGFTVFRDSYPPLLL